jgi:hypothetical protein
MGWSVWSCKNDVNKCVAEAINKVFHIAYSGVRYTCFAFLLTEMIAQSGGVLWLCFFENA